MSEFINARDNRTTIRWKLLTGASALALTAYVSSGGVARADDSNHPLLWLELGGSFDLLNDPSGIWTPPDLPPVIDHPVTGVLSQKPRFGYDMDGKITFQPNGSDWNLSASIHYGKAKRGPKFAHDQTYNTHLNPFLGVPALTTYAFTDLNTVSETKHLILDFQAGKDVGLGLFGGRGNSNVKFGVRIAQFDEKADGLMSAVTDLPAKYLALYHYGNFLNDQMHADRNFSGIGPSLAWNGSVPLAGSLDDGLAFDWGANAALLFGRQRAKVRLHRESAYFTGSSYNPVRHIRSHSTSTIPRSKRVTVPNLGGFAGFSYRLGGEAKISLGYRADFFFGAIDGGIDARKTENRGFYGPFASISIGIGD